MELGGSSHNVSQLTGAGGLAHPAEAASSQLISAGSSVRVLGSWTSPGCGRVRWMVRVVRPLGQWIRWSICSVQGLGIGSRHVGDLPGDSYWPRDGKGGSYGRWGAKGARGAP